MPNLVPGQAGLDSVPRLLQSNLQQPKCRAYDIVLLDIRFQSTLATLASDMGPVWSGSENLFMYNSVTQWTITQKVPLPVGFLHAVHHNRRFVLSNLV